MVPIDRILFPVGNVSMDQKAILKIINSLSESGKTDEFHSSFLVSSSEEI
jgi:hypothetical protein